VKLLALAALVVLSGGCLANPQRVQSVELLEQLASARQVLSGQTPPYDDACTIVGDVQTRLFGEPGLNDVQPAYGALRDAADALQAACSQTTLLDQATADTPASRQARERWQQGSIREVAVACDHLRAAAVALGRSAPC
jgi:hypothetical protein